jgi:hypothetical protein
VHCFNHPDRVAIGSCKACCKGLCSECAVDMEHGLACRGKHERTVEKLNSITARAAQIQTTSGKVKYAAAIFYAFMGAFFLAYGYFRDGLGGFLVPLGGGFLVYSVVVFLANRRAFRKSTADA